MRQPRDDLQGVELFLLGIFAICWYSLAAAKAADVDACTNVTTTGKVGVQGIITRGGPIIFPIGGVFEHGGEFIARLSSIWHVQLDREADAILHRNPCVFHSDAVSRWRRRNGCETGQCRG